MPRTLLTAVLVLATQAGCVQHEGTVIKKEYKPLQCYVRAEPLLLVSGSVVTGTIPVLYYDTEYHRIDIKRSDGGVETYYVTDGSVFESLHEGDFFKFDPKVASTDYRVIRLRLAEHEFAKVTAADGATTVEQRAQADTGPSTASAPAQEHAVSQPREDSK